MTSENDLNIHKMPKSKTGKHSGDKVEPFSYDWFQIMITSQRQYKSKWEVKKDLKRLFDLKWYESLSKTVLSKFGKKFYYRKSCGNNVEPKKFVYVLFDEAVIGLSQGDPELAEHIKDIQYTPYLNEEGVWYRFELVSGTIDDTEQPVLQDGVPIYLEAQISEDKKEKKFKLNAMRMRVVDGSGNDEYIEI